MKQKIGSVLQALLGAMLLMDGMKGNTAWADVPALFGPLAVLGLAIIAFRAWNGESQTQLPQIKKVGKKP
jgi:hypothetical protein